MRKVIAVLFAGAIAIGVTTSAAYGSKISSQVASKTTRPSGHLTIAIDNYPQDLDPYSPTLDPQSLEVFDSWWEYLVEPTNNGSSYVPTLASKYAVSNRDKTYTFTIRSGVEFSNGTPLTTADVVYSLHQAFYQTGSQINFLESKIASITAPTASTVVVRLKSSWPYLLADLSGFNAPILPAKLVESEGLAAFLKHPIGTGPFMLSSESPGNSVTVVANPHYWQPGLPHLASLTFQAVGSDVGRVTAVEGGQAQVAADPPLNQLTTLRANSALKVLTFPASDLISIIVNTKASPVSNEKLREAIGMAINRDAIVKAALFGTGTAATTFIVPPAALTLQDSNVTGFGYDPTEAKKLLDESGLKTPVTVQAYFPQGAVQDAISTIMQQNLQAIGINLQIVRSDLVTIKSHLKAGTYVMASSGWDDFIGDPSTQALFFEEPSYCCNDDFSNYSNAAASALAVKAVGAITTSAAASLFDRLQQDEAKSAQVIPLYYPENVILESSKVSGFYVNPFGTYSYPTIALSS